MTCSKYSHFEDQNSLYDPRGHTPGQTHFLRHLPASSSLFDVSHIKVSEESETGRLSPSFMIHFILLQIMERSIRVRGPAAVMWIHTGDVPGAALMLQIGLQAQHSHALMLTLSRVLAGRKLTASTFVFMLGIIQ